jgi:hypothetical protein
MRESLFIFITFLPLTGALSADPANRIVREIYCDNRMLWISDTIRCGEYFSLGDPALNVMFEASRAGQTNLLSEARNLLKPDSLIVESCGGKFESGYMSVAIHSRISSQKNNSVKLRWLASFSGKKLKFPNMTVASSGGGEILVYGEGGQYFLWFPDLDPAPAEIDEKSTEFKKAFEVFPQVMADKETEMMCSVRSSDVVTFLAHWWNIPKSSDVPGNALLRRMRQDHAFSNNDLMGLLTNLRLAKPGYYDVRPRDARQNDRTQNAKR